MAEDPERIGQLAVGRTDSLRQQVYHHLRGRLQRGEVAPGERLIDTAIAQAMGVSRMPVREALLQLMNEGYLVGTTRGFTLPQLDAKDIADIFEVRKLLEPRAAACAARDLDDDGRAALGKALNRAEAALAQRDMLELSFANVSFRETWLGAIRNERLAATISRFADHVQIVRLGTLRDRATQPIVVDGLRRLHDAFSRRDAVAAQDRMLAFIVEAEKSFFLGHHEKAAETDAVKRRQVQRKGAKNV